MQGAEIEDDGSVLKYMTKSEIEEQRSSLLIMTQRLPHFQNVGPVWLIGLLVMDTKKHLHVVQVFIR